MYIGKYRMYWTEERPDEMSTIRILKYKPGNDQTKHYSYMLIEYYMWEGKPVFRDLSNEFHRYEINDFEKCNGKILWSEPLCTILDLQSNRTMSRDPYYIVKPELTKDEVLSEEFKRIKGANISLRRINNELEKEYVRLKEVVRQLVKESIMISDKFNTKQEENYILKEENEKLKKENEELHKQFDCLFNMKRIKALI